MQSSGPLPSGVISIPAPAHNSLTSSPGPQNPGKPKPGKGPATPEVSSSGRHASIRSFASEGIDAILNPVATKVNPFTLRFDSHELQEDFDLAVFRTRVLNFKVYLLMVGLSALADFVYNQGVSTVSMVGSLIVLILAVVMLAALFVWRRRGDNTVRFFSWMAHAMSTVIVVWVCFLAEYLIRTASRNDDSASEGEWRVLVLVSGILVSHTPFLNPMAILVQLVVIVAVTLALFSEETELAETARANAVVWIVGAFGFFFVIAYDRLGNLRLRFLQYTRLRRANMVVEMSYGTSTIGRRLHLNSGSQFSGPRASRTAARVAYSWRIDEDAVRIEQPLGRGSFGTTYRGSWRNSVVCVKQSSDSSARHLSTTDLEEVVNIMKLRHPNLATILGFSDQGAKLLVVTEYCENGALFDVLHTRAPGTVPPDFNIDTIQSVAKALNFLHTNVPPILHRNLKSVNVLLDEKWNVKVTDYISVLTARPMERSMASLVYMAPEVMERLPHTIKSDVFSFAILSWEILSRQFPQPKASGARKGAAGMGSQASDKAVRVSNFKNQSQSQNDTLSIIYGVVRERLRPAIGEIDAAFRPLIKDCWAADPAARPTTADILVALTALRSTVPAAQQPAASSANDHLRTSASLDSGVPAGTITSLSGTIGGNAASSYPLLPVVHASPSQGPVGRLAIVLTEVEGAQALWDSAVQEMRDALAVSNKIVRDLIHQHEGYEVKAEAGAFFVVFKTALSSVLFSLDMLEQMRRVEWPANLPQTVEGVPGLSHRIGIHFGQPITEIDAVSRRTNYFGPPVAVAGRVISLARGGTTLLSFALCEQLSETECDRFSVQKVAVTDGGDDDFEVYVVEPSDTAPGTNVYVTNEDEPMADKARGSELLSMRRFSVWNSAGASAAPESMASERGSSWVVSFQDLTLERQLGSGTSGGETYYGKFRDRDVAIKKISSGHAKRRHRFYEEACLLRWISHPNVVQLVAACMQAPNYCLVLEYVPNTLREVLEDPQYTERVRDQELSLTYGVAKGMVYVHNSQIKHRRLNTYNVRLDAAASVWVPKLSDFSLAAVKSEGEKMRGSMGGFFETKQSDRAYWVPPEVLKGDEFSQRGDVYSFGWIVWEMVTGGGVPFKDVPDEDLPARIKAMDLPAIPRPPTDVLYIIITSCWRSLPRERRQFRDIIVMLKEMVKDPDALGAPSGQHKPQLEPLPARARGKSPEPSGGKSRRKKKKQ